MISRIHRDFAPIPGDVLEVDGSDHPVLAKGFSGSYDGIEIGEKDTCYDIYDRSTLQPIKDSVAHPYAMVISMTLPEHACDKRAILSNIDTALLSGGITHHYAPSANHPHFAAPPPHRVS